MANETASVELLRDQLAQVLTKWPLYRHYTYVGKEAHHVNQQAVTKTRFAFLPPELKMFCNKQKCGYETAWKTSEAEVYFGSDFIKRRRYTCRNCGLSEVYYCFIWQERADDSVFVKVGQYPELEERVPEKLVEALDREDLKLYQNSLRLRNFNLGVAAVAYMRRIVENRMNDMLEILHEAAIAHDAPADLIAKHEEMKQERRFNVKVDYAGTLLPRSLRPEGKPNPIAILHELASDGLHAKSDEECVDIFDSCRRTFEYLFGKLRVENEDAKAFVQEMAMLAEKKSKG
jgi:hypothetical protein